MKLGSVFALGLIGLTALFACGDDDDDQPGGGGGSSSSSSSGSIVGNSSSSSSGGTSGANADKYIAALCARTLSCTPGEFATQYKSQDDCVAFGKSLPAGAELPGANITQAEADACAAAITAAPCAIRFNEIEACTYKGTLATGTGCFVGSQCSGGRCKRTDTASDCGVCDELSTSDVCNDDGDCVFGYECFGESGVGHCTKLATSGASCSNDMVDCGPGLKCLGGTCQAAVERDGNCSSGGSGNACRDGLSCTNGTCKDNTIGVADLGGSCDDQTVCRQSSCVNGTCVTYAATGQECGGAKPDCDLQNNCSAGICAKNTFPACN